MLLSLFLKMKILLIWTLNKKYLHTRGGPAKKTVPWFRTMILSSAIAGIYAPPAVHEPMTTAT